MDLNIDEAMVQAMRYLESIFSDLERLGQRHAANEVGRLSSKIVDVYLKALADVSQGESANEDVKPHASHHVVNHPAASYETTQKQTGKALIHEVEKGQNNTTSVKNYALQPLPAPSKASAQHDSWAQVAGTESRALEPLPPPNKGAAQSGIWATGSVLGTPDSSLEPASVPSPLSLTPSPTHHNDSGSGSLGPSTPAEPAELPEERAGVIRINGPVSRDSINTLTSRIHEGPLLEIRVETNSRTRVVFQHLAHARAFLKNNDEMVAILGFGRFGVGYTVELVEVINWDEDLYRMCQPHRERRRLSFARKRLFADNVSPERWKHDIRSIAGPGNIDIFWVFNSGNATAVFTSTTVARRVLEAFNRWNQVRGAYFELSVTYSSDPCEKPLSLIKDHSNHHNGRYMARKPLR